MAYNSRKSYSAWFYGINTFQYLLITICNLNYLTRMCNYNNNNSFRSRVWLVSTTVISRSIAPAPTISAVDVSSK
jgi:hypothetical protein